MQPSPGKWSIHALALGLLFAGTVLHAQTVEVLLERYVYPPVITNFVSVSRAAVNNRGDWIARVARDNGDVAVKNGVILIDNNSPVTTQNSFASFSINNSGHTASIGYHRDAVLDGFSDGLQLYFNSLVLVAPGQPVPSSELAANVVWRYLYSAVINDESDIYVVGTAANGFDNTANSINLIMRYRVDVAGTIVETELIMKDEDPFTVDSISGELFDPTRDHERWEVNNAGDLITWLSFLPITGRGFRILRLNDAVLFRENGTDFIPGRTNKYLSAAYLNDTGNWVATVGFANQHTLSQMLIRDGLPFIERGDLLPNGSTLVTIINKAYIAHNGDIYWLGSWRKPDDSLASGMLLNRSVLVEDGVTQVDGRTINVVAYGNNRFDVSDNGRYVVFPGQIGGRDAFFRITVPEKMRIAVSASYTSPTNCTLSCRPAEDLEQVHLLQSTDMISWAPAMATPSDWMTRPINGWVSDPPTWDVSPTNVIYYKVAGTTD